MADLEHPHIVRVLLKRGIELYSYGHIIYYFVMEFVQGGDFKRAVLENAIGLDERIRVILEVASALELAHGRGLVHRDVSPDNILLDENGSAKLTDFDLVYASDSTGGTKGGLGKFLYTAPEVQDNAENVDMRADVHGLAMTLVFALYGWNLPTESLANRTLFIKNIKYKEDVGFVLCKAAHVDPDGRYASIAEFVTELKRALCSRVGFVRLMQRKLIVRMFFSWASVCVMCLCLGLIGVTFAEFTYGGSREVRRGWRSRWVDALDYADLVMEGKLPWTKKLRLWPNGSVLRVCFLDGNPVLHGHVKEIASEWTRYANLSFDFVSMSSCEADIRISFEKARIGRSIGTDARKRLLDEPTMSLHILADWSESSHDEKFFSAIVLREFGFALGLEDELASPNASMIWNYEYIKRLERRVAHYVVGEPFSQTEPPYRELDLMSVMASSPYDEEVLLPGYDIQLNCQLSESDKEFIARLYPRQP